MNMNNVHKNPEENESLEPASAVDVENKENKDPEIDPANPEDKEPEGSKEPVAPKKKFTKRERLEHAKGKIDKQLEALNEEDDDDDDDRPLTRGDLKRMKLEESQSEAIDLANSIEDEEEREQVIDLLENSIKPSGDAIKDLELAISAINGLKNGQIAEELGRQGTVKRVAAKPGNPGKHEKAFVPTDQEAVFMRAPYNLSKEAIIKARMATEANRQE